MSTSVVEITEVAANLAAAIAAAFAIYGINSWRQEHTGRRRIDLAEKVLAAFYKAAEVVRWMRSPAVRSGEVEGLPEREGETEDERRLRQEYSVPLLRYNSKMEHFAEVLSLKYQCMAVFGASWGEPFDELHRICQDVINAARRLFELKKDRGDWDDKVRWSEDVRKFEAIFWSDPGDQDPTEQRLRKVIANVEDLCRQNLK